MTRQYRAIVWAALFAAAWTCGCGGGRNADLARQAEDRGELHVAYDYYCRAAQEHRNSLTVADGLDRTRPAAAAHWERLALTAEDEGRFEDAWRFWMRTIEVQPDHATAAQMVRRLESQHSMQVASAREDWVRRGSSALPAAKLEPKSTARQRTARSTESSDAGESRTALAARSPNDKPKTQVAPRRAAQVRRPEPAAQTKDGADADQSVMRGTSVDEGDDRPTMQADLEKQNSVHPADADDGGTFTVVRTYSMKDQRFPRSGEAIDGISMKLKDTDEDDDVIDVDLDLLNGGVRVRKVRELRVGRSLTFRGASGKTFRLTIISAHHRTHTVRVGFKPI